MRLAQIEDGTVINAIEVDPGSIPDWAAGWPELTGDAGPDWLWDGVAFAPPAGPPPTVEEYRAAVQAHVDAAAVARLYDSGVSLASYIGSTNPIWAAEAAAFVAWRDEVWAAVYTLWAAPPTYGDLSIEALIDSLPPITWPS